MMRHWNGDLTRSMHKGPPCLCFVLWINALSLIDFEYNAPCACSCFVYVTRLRAPRSRVPPARPFFIPGLQLRSSVCLRFPPACLCPRGLRCGCQRRTSKAHYGPPPLRKQLWFPALKCNPLLCVSPRILCSYQLLQDEKLSIQQPQKKKTIPSPLLLVSTQPIFTQNQPSGQAAIKNPGPFGEGVGAREPQIYKLDFHSFPSCSLPSTRRLRRRRLCGLRARCNYNHICQRCITHDREELSCGAYDPVTNEWAA